MLGHEDLDLVVILLADPVRLESDLHFDWIIGGDFATGWDEKDGLGWVRIPDSLPEIFEDERHFEIADVFDCERFLAALVKKNSPEIQKPRLRVDVDVWPHAFPLQQTTDYALGCVEH